jgi:Na+/H+ antiporter NhaC
MITSNITIIFAIIAGVVVLLVWNRVPVVIVALGTALALYATGVLDLGHAMAGLSATPRSSSYRRYSWSARASTRRA